MNGCDVVRHLLKRTLVYDEFCIVYRGIESLLTGQPLLLDKLKKLSSPFEPHWLGNFDNLDIN